MRKDPLILKFNQLEIDFSTIEHSELLEKLFKNKPVSYFPTLLYFALFNVSYENLVAKKEEPFSFITTYKELGEKFNCALSTLSNALSRLEEANLIVKERLMIPNDNPNSNLNWKYVLNITIKLPSGIKKSLQNKAEAA